MEGGSPGRERGLVAEGRGKGSAREGGEGAGSGGDSGAMVVVVATPAEGGWPAA